MSLLLSEVQRFKAFVLMLVSVLVTGSMMFGASPASATEGVTASAGASSCSSVDWTVNNATSQYVYVYTYTINNGVRTDNTNPFKVEPGQSFVLNGPLEKYFTHEFGIKTSTQVMSTSGAYTVEMTDWGTATYVPPSECPLLAPAKIIRYGNAVISKPRPIFTYKAKAYYTDFGYTIVGKSTKIKWVSTLMSPGKYTAQGPLLKPGQRVRLKFFSRNVDDSMRTSAPVLIGKTSVSRAG